MKDTVSLDAKPTKEESFSAKVAEREGRPVIVPYDQAAWIRTLAKLKGLDVVVKIDRPKKTRSLQANAYLWAVVYPDVLDGLRELAVAAGEKCPFKDVDELHEAMKYMVLGVEVVEVPGVGTLERPSTTTTLTTGEFARYVDTIIRWAGERGIPVRQPGEEIVA